MILGAVWTAKVAQVSLSAKDHPWSSAFKAHSEHMSNSLKMRKDLQRWYWCFLDFNMIWYARVVTKDFIVTNSRRKPLQPSGKPRLWCDWLFCAWRSSLRSSHAILKNVLLRSTCNFLIGNEDDDDLFLYYFYNLMMYVCLSLSSILQVSCSLDSEPAFARISQWNSSLQWRAFPNFP